MLSVVRPVLFAALLLASAHARAQVESREGIVLQNQIYQLRTQMQALQDQISRGGGAPPRTPAYAPPPQPYGNGGSDLVTQLLTRVDTQEEQVRQLRGRVDELQNQLQQEHADLSKRIDDMQFQLGQGTQRGTAPGTSPAAVPAPSSPPPSTPRTPETLLQEGNAALVRHDYAAAEASARQVLSNKVSPRAYDANLLLAQALAGQKQFPQAAIAYDDTYNRARKGSHAQDALLGLANSLNAINEKKASCDTLSKLRAEFSQMRPDIRDAAGALGQKANCR